MELLGAQCASLASFSASERSLASSSDAGRSASPSAPAARVFGRKRVFDRSLDTADSAQKWKKARNFERLAEIPARENMPASNPSHLRKWDEFLKERGLWEADCALPELDLFADWLPLNNVVAGAQPYLSTARCRLGIGLGAHIDQKMYNVVVARLKTFLAADFGVQEGASAALVFAHDFVGLSAADAGVLRLFCCAGQRSIDYSRALAVEGGGCGFHLDKREGKIFFTNAVEEKTKNFHDCTIAAVAQTKKGLSILQKKAGSVAFVDEVIARVNKKRNAKSGKISLHSFRRTLAVSARRKWELSKSRKRRSLFSLVQAISRQAGWSEPDEMNLGAHSFFGYSRDWKSWSQPLGLSDALLELLLPELCP